MSRPVSNLLEKIRSLPSERIAEVEDFIDFLRQRDEDRRLTQAATKLAEDASGRCGTTTKMPSTTSYEFGDVVLIPFPFTDQTTHKQRPAAVVSSAAYNRDRRDHDQL